MADFVNCCHDQSLLSRCLSFSLWKALNLNMKQTCTLIANCQLPVAVVPINVANGAGHALFRKQFSCLYMIPFTRHSASSLQVN